jgi:hypothetical protein
MTDNRTAELSRRLDTLEREHRRMKRLGGGALAGLSLLTLVSFAAPVCKTVWAERFVLQDASNRARLTLNAYGTEQPGITFHDGRGQAVASFSMGGDGSLGVQVIEDGKAVPARFTVTEAGALAFARVSDAASATPATAAKKPASGNTGVN